MSQPSLTRSLSLYGVFCIASGAMISSGLFVLPGLAYALAGPAVIASYLLAALLVTTGMLSQAEIVSAMPKAGGTYFYVTRSLGPVIGAIDGLMTWFSLSLKTAFAIVGLSAFIALLLPFHPYLVGAVLVPLFVILNIVGVKEASWLQNALVTGLLLALGYFVVGGAPTVEVADLSPFAPQGWRAVFAAAGLVFVAYGGLLQTASIAEETRAPGRVVPLALILSLLIVSLFYVATVFVAVGALGTNLAGSMTPISSAARAFAGGPGYVILTAAAVLAFVTTANAGIMAASRYLLALSRDGMLPDTFAVIHRRFDTPHRAVLLTGALVLATQFLELKLLVEAASSVLIISFIFSCLSVVVLRESRLQNYRPRFKAPLYPWLQIAGLLGFVALLITMGIEAWIVCTIFVAVALLVYWLYGRIRATREYALLYLAERIAARELTSHHLETELKEIIHERDDVVKDRFDYVVENTDVLDLEGPLAGSELFREVARALAPTLGTSEAKVHALLAEREQQSTTALTPFVAIPHIILEGEHHFRLLIVRCREGAHFSETAPGVRAIFVLAGTLDERPFHLQALAALASIVQNSRFEERWLAARGEKGLRDVLLLGQRRRYTLEK